MTNDDAFLQAIIEDPDNDVPRLVYADWLEERGRPHGEFIRIQCELARACPGDERLPSLRRREEELLGQHRREWLGPLHSLAYRWDFKRGFPEEAALPAQDFLESVAQLFHSTPLRLVRLLKSQNWVDELAACPYLRRLRALHLSNNNLGFKGLQALLSSPYLGEIRSLRLGDNWLTEDSGLTLAEARHLHRLTTLSLSDNMLGDEGVIQLASAPHFSRLTTLHLGNNQITDFGAQALAESPHLSRLKTLDLGNVIKGAEHGPNSIGSKGREALLQRFTPAVCML
jgi:uncharacterized protein (TIGR02996 family)